MCRYSTFECTKKSSSKPIDMGSSFKDLDARSSKVKTVRNLDKRFSRYFVFQFRFKKIKGKTYPPTEYKYTENGVQTTLTAEVQLCSNPEYKYVQTECTGIQLLNVQIFFRQNLSTWDLVLKISTREVQKWKRFVISISGSQDISFFNFGSKK